MNDEHELRQTLFPLLDTLIEGNISIDDHARLETLLDENADACRLYSQYLELDLGIQQLQLSDAQPNAIEELLRQTAQPSAGSRARLVLLSATMATAVCVLIALFSYPLWQASDSSSDPIANSAAGDPGRETTNQEEAKPAIAMVMHLIDVQWSDGYKKFSLGDSVVREWLHVSSGILQLKFSSGAALTLEGPARLRIDSETECFVQKGKAVVLGPPGFPEFTITSPGSRVVDIGTEFAVVVRESGETDVHVLDGEVDVTLVDDKQRSVGTQRLV
ncbi:MAG: FecR domain-containing protein, partial [Pirellulaceae bacterium]